MTEPSPSQKRVDQRFPIQAHVRFRLLQSPDGEPAEPELHNGNNVIWNISRTGIFLATKNFLEVQSIVELEFPVAEFNEVVRTKAEVVRANYQNFPNQGKYEYGLRFMAMEPPYRETLDRFIKVVEG